MSRQVRAATAAETDRLVLEGHFGPVPASVLYPPDVPLPLPGGIGTSTVEVANETTLAAAARHRTRPAGRHRTQPGDRVREPHEAWPDPAGGSFLLTQRAVPVVRNVAAAPELGGCGGDAPADAPPTLRILRAVAISHTASG
jgi:hypothetical protein